MPNEEWIAGRYVKALLSTERGGDIVRQSLLRKGLGQDPARVSTEDYAAVLQDLWLELKDESFGFTENGLRPGGFALLCQVLQTCVNLEHALRRCTRVYGLLTQDFVLRLENFSEENRLVLYLARPLQGDASFFTEAFFSVLLRLMSWLIDQPIPPLAIALPYAKDKGTYSFEQKYSCPILYKSEHAYLSLPPGLMKAVLRRESSEINDILRRALHHFLIDFRKESNFVAQLKTLLTRDVQNLSLDLDSCASQLGIGSSSLRRKLKEEGENFNSVRENLRRQRAMHYLKHTHMDIDSIASLLGYSEPSTFHRAFRKWTGQTPRGFRHGKSPSAAADP